MKSKSKRLYPKLLTVLGEGYRLQTFLNDLTSGVLVGIVALPLAIAFAIASGLKPEQGLYTAVVAGLVIPILGGSRVQVSGPAGAFIVIVYGIVERYGYSGLQTATLMAGVMLILMGLVGLGSLLRFISYPLTVGFTSGIAAIIFSSQIRDLLGLPIAKVPGDFVEKWRVIFEHIGQFDWNALSIGALSIIIISLWPYITRKIPGSLIAILASTLAVKFLALPVETVGSRFGNVPATLPAPSLPDLSLTTIQGLFMPALTIAMLGAIESLLCAVVSDGMMGGRHRSDMELVAQGVGNIASPIFQGMPATGAIARTATNVKNGGRTPVSAIVHALTLLLIMLFFAPWAAEIPMPSLAAILIVVAYNMSEWRTFVALLRSPKSDVLVLVTTFLLTVLIDLTVAIEVGIVLSSLLFMRSMSEESEVVSLSGENGSEELFIDRSNIPEGVQIFEIHGPLFFGAIEQFKNAVSVVSGRGYVLILNLKYVRRIDASGLHALEQVLSGMKVKGGSLILCGLNTQPRRILERSGFLSKLSPQNVCDTLDSGIEAARSLIGWRSE